MRTLTLRFSAMLILACTLALPLAAAAATAGSGIESIVQGGTVNNSPRIHGTDTNFEVTVLAFVDNDDWGNTAVFVDNVFYDCIDTTDYGSNTGDQTETFDVPIADVLLVPGTYTIGFSAATAANTLCAVPSTPQDNATPDLVIASQSTVTVSKEFSDGNELDVNINLVCTSGVITPDANEDAGFSGPAVFTVTGFDDGTTCTATETANTPGYTVDESACLNLALVSDADAPCTITNTQDSLTVFVAKDFSDNNTAAVTMVLTCPTATVTTVNASATEGTPSEFTVSDFPFGGENCSAVEDAAPTGYTEDATGCAVIALAPGAAPQTCTIINNQDSVDVVVAKDFSDDNTADVTFALACPGATVTGAGTASEATPATFTVSDFPFAGTSCVATEPTVPTGYTVDETDCTAVGVALGQTPGDGPDCTIVNNQGSVSITANKDFSDNNTMGVATTLTCDGGTIAPNADGSGTATELAPMVYTLSDFPAGGTTCSVTEAAPAGYTEASNTCADMPVGTDAAAPDCLITNNQLPVIFKAAKDFDDDNGAPVLFAASCLEGNVTITLDLTTDGGPAAEWLVSDFPYTGTTCTVTEPIVPDGYTVDESDCVAIGVVPGQLSADPDCTILNELGTVANFLVTKEYSDNNPDEVEVTLTCTSGLPLQQPSDISDGHPVNFVLTNVDEAVTNCTVTETGHADGYTPFFVAGGDTAGSTGGTENCTFPNVAPGDMNTCEIRNAADDATFTAYKVWEINAEVGDEVNTLVPVTIVCDSLITGSNGIIDDHDFFSATKILGDGDSLWVKVNTTTGPAWCSAFESIIQSGVESIDDCDGRLLTAGDSDSCTFTNTVFFEGIPTLSQYGLALMALLMLGMGMVGFRRFA